MNDDPAITPNPPAARTPAPIWAAVFALLLCLFLCTVAFQLGTLFAAWGTQLQKVGYSAQSVLAYGIIAPLIVGLPGLLLLFVRTPRPAAVARTLLLATAAAFLLILPRLFFTPEASYAAGFLRAGISALFGIALLIGARRGGRAGGLTRSGIGMALLLAALWLLPWLRFGALGDGFDGLAALAQALGFALLSAGLAAYLMPRLVATSPNRSANFWLGGVTLGVIVLALAGSWGQMDYQALMMLALPALGFALAWLGLAERYDVVSAVTLMTAAAFGPLAFADPRETLLIGLLSGDTFVYTLRAAWWDFLLGAAAIIGLAFTAPRLPGARGQRVVGGLALGAWAMAALVYFFSGQPGFFGDDFFVALGSQADLAQAANIADVGERRAWVYQTLVEHADREQAELMAWLDARGIDYTRYYLVNGLEIHAPAWRRWQLANRPEVDRILYSPELRPLPQSLSPEPADETGDAPAETPWGIEAIGAPQVWADFGVTGAGAVIGQSDSGVDPDHPALAASYRGRTMGDDYNWLDPWYEQSHPYDLNGHGTHTLGTALGQQVGVAPGATWFACANLVRNLGNPAHYLDCMQFMLAPFPQSGDPLRDGRPDLAADVSTNSWGCPPTVEGCDQLTLWQAAEALRAAGIFFVAAAGNDGPACDSLQSPPGNYGNVLSVGALSPDGSLTSFSSRGPDTNAPDGNEGPDVLAPGDDVLSAWPGGWKSAGGTSMAAPHVAGVVALMWSANPALRGDVAATERILQETAAPFEGETVACDTDDALPDAATGYGVVDAYAAVQRALEMR